MLVKGRVMKGYSPFLCIAGGRSEISLGLMSLSNMVQPHGVATLLAKKPIT